MVSRYAEGDYARLPALAADLVRLKVDVIPGAGAPAVGAAQNATTAIPIVIGTAGDPGGTGFARSLARPGGNIAGLSDLSSDPGSKLAQEKVGAVIATADPLFNVQTHRIAESAVRLRLPTIFCCAPTG